MKKKILKWLFIIIPALLLITFVFYMNIILNNNKEKITSITKKEFQTKDQRVTFSASEEFISQEQGEYDLYLTRKEKGKNRQALGVFTYYLNEYEENSSKQILDKQINYFLENKKNMKIFKKEYTTSLDDKTITTVEYSGNADTSTDCIYIFSVIDFSADTNYVVYVNEIILKKDYEKVISQMKDILKSAKLN